MALREKAALFMGRFQPPTAAHANTVAVMLEEWQTAIISVMRNGPLLENLHPE